MPTNFSSLKHFLAARDDLMVQPYDILIVAGEGESEFLEAATTLDAAMTRAKELTAVVPSGEYKIYSHITGILFPVTVR